LQAVLVTGPPGAGKSALAGALHDSLGGDGIANALIELDELERSYPPPAAERAFERLTALCASFAADGHELLLVTATAVDDAYAESVLAATGAAERLVVRLEARADTLAARIRSREPADWSGLDRLVDAARELEQPMRGLAGVDIVIDADATPIPEAVERVRAALGR